MRILIVGSGGREHALAWKLKRAKSKVELIIAPGNGGTALEGENVPVADDDLPGLIRLAKERQVDLVVPGPELPLVLGLKDALDKEGIPCFGPNAYAAQLEGSKAFAKTVMREAGVPTAAFRVFDEAEEAKAFVRASAAPVVVKADGLAAGKGVVVAKTVEEAEAALDDMMVKGVFGTAGERVVIEEVLVGEEASLLAFCDGKRILTMPAAQDHKAAYDGDEGPNTGGMGAYCPAPIIPPEDYDRLARLTIAPIVEHMAAKGSPFKGVLYAGLMMTAKGPMVLEYNVRFGDPECQPLLMRLDTDLLEIMFSCINGRLDRQVVHWSSKAALCVVLAAEGYPGPYRKGVPIEGVDEAEDLMNVKVFQAGAALQEGRIVSTGGRVLGVTALGDGLASAKKLAYQAVERIRFEGGFHRSDIGDKGLKRK